jgi:trans-AT polyketide synthase/acyltransferase/oxidoreductase domain-containing protein
VTQNRCSNRVSGFWQPASHQPETSEASIYEAIRNLSHSVYLIDLKGRIGIATDGWAAIGSNGSPPSESYPLLAWSPDFPLSGLGDTEFKWDHGLQYAYICGAMANGISSVEMVEAAGNAGMIGFFGAGGLSLEEIEKSIEAVQNRLSDKPYGFNLIHSPNDLALEQKTVDLYIAKGVRLISASAFLDITTPLVQYRIHGIHRTDNGRISCPNHVIAKVSREEVARKFFSPPAEKHLKRLREEGKITSQEAELAERIPMAQDLTAEADSGGHTDNRPALSLFPTMQSIKNEMTRKHGFQMNLRVGLGGGIATPESAAAAFAMGAAYVLTGSVNQSCVEADTSPLVKKMLAEARQADIIMAPAADMFEMGVKVQVLKRGTMFSMRGSKLYDIYRTYDRFEDVPEMHRKMVENTFLLCSFDQEWKNTRTFFEMRDPEQVEKAEQDPKHKMALVFRSYLGRASLWAKNGVPERAIDYQIWCGPAMGAFNEWVRGSFLEPPENRETVTVAKNLLYGAALSLRLNHLKNQGVCLPSQCESIKPVTPEKIDSLTGRS